MNVARMIFGALTIAVIAGCTTTPAIDASGKPIVGPDGKQLDRVCIGLSCPIQKLIRGDDMGKAPTDRPGVISGHLGTIPIGGTPAAQAPAQTPPPADSAPAPAPQSAAPATAN